MEGIIEPPGTLIEIDRDYRNFNKQEDIIMGHSLDEIDDPSSSYTFGEPLPLLSSKSHIYEPSIN